MAALTITAANVDPTATATIVTKTAGATITAGQALYLDSSSLLQLARANAASTDAVVGIALNSASANQPCSYITGGNFNPGATVAAGVYYYLSDAAAGAIVPVADLGSGDYVTKLMYGTTSSECKVEITTTGLALA